EKNRCHPERSKGSVASRILGDAQDDNCDGCGLINRRDFLRGAVFITAGVAALATTAEPVFALPMIGGVRLSSDEKSFPIPAADGAQIDKDLDLILSRVGEKVYAFSLACPHQNTAIRWEPDHHRFQCPKHHS